MATKWVSGIVKWQEQGVTCLSVPFTWLLGEARGYCISHPNDRVVVGGAAVRLIPDFFRSIRNAEVEIIEPAIPPLRRANPEASRSTFGCPNRCEFCGVRTIEGEFKEIEDFTPAPIMCDSNFLACSDTHFNRVIDRLKEANFDEVDFNQGLEAKLLTKERAERLAEINIAPRFAWDNQREESSVFKAVQLMVSAGVKKYRFKGIYCLVGFGEEPSEALYRLQTLKDNGLRGFAMRYQPLDAMGKNEYWPPQWGRKELKDFVRYWNRQSQWGGISYEEYRSGQKPKNQLMLF